MSIPAVPGSTPYPLIYPPPINGTPIQANTRTIRRQVHQVAEKMEAKLEDEQASFIEGMFLIWDQLPEPDPPLTVALMAAMSMPGSMITAQPVGLKSLSARVCRRSVTPNALPLSSSTMKNRNAACMKP